MLKSCLTCKIEFEAKTTAMWCSKECKKVHTKKCVEENKRLKAEEQKKSFVQTDDKVQCLICGGAWGSLSSHLSRTHNITADEYKARFNVGSEAIFSKKNLALMSERMAGSNNIAAGHGGRLSPFSKNNKKLDGKNESEKEAFVKESVGKWIKTVPKEDRPMNVEYWVKRGMTEEDARAEVSRRQATFSLEKCKERYGEEEGLKRWQERQELWHSNYKKSNYSKISQELFFNLVDYVPDAQFAEHTGEKIFKTLNGSVYKLDFWSPSTKKIIEFDGDYWHSEKLLQANPGRNENRDKEILSTDKSIRIMHVKEIEYKQNKKGTIEKCLTFLKE